MRGGSRASTRGRRRGAWAAGFEDGEEPFWRGTMLRRRAFLCVGAPGACGSRRTRAPRVGIRRRIAIAYRSLARAARQKCSQSSFLFGFSSASAGERAKIENQRLIDAGNCSMASCAAACRLQPNHSRAKRNAIPSTTRQSWRPVSRQCDQNESSPAERSRKCATS